MTLSPNNLESRIWEFLDRLSKTDFTRPIPAADDRRARPTPSTAAQDSGGERAGSSHPRSSHGRSTT